MAKTSVTAYDKNGKKVKGAYAENGITYKADGTRIDAGTKVVTNGGTYQLNSDGTSTRVSDETPTKPSGSKVNTETQIVTNPSVSSVTTEDSEKEQTPGSSTPVYTAAQQAKLKENSDAWNAIEQQIKSGALTGRDLMAARLTQQYYNQQNDAIRGTKSDSSYIDNIVKGYNLSDASIGLNNQSPDVNSTNGVIAHDAYGNGYTLYFDPTAYDGLGGYVRLPENSIVQDLSKNGKQWGLAAGQDVGTQINKPAEPQVIKEEDTDLKLTDILAALEDLGLANNVNWTQMYDDKAKATLAASLEQLDQKTTQLIKQQEVQNAEAEEKALAILNSAAQNGGSVGTTASAIRSLLEDYNNSETLNKAYDELNNFTTKYDEDIASGKINANQTYADYLIKFINAINGRDALQEDFVKANNTNRANILINQIAAAAQANANRGNSSAPTVLDTTTQEGQDAVSTSIRQMLNSLNQNLLSSFDWGGNNKPQLTEAGVQAIIGAVLSGEIGTYSDGKNSYSYKDVWDWVKDQSGAGAWNKRSVAAKNGGWFVDVNPHNEIVDTSKISEIPDTTKTSKKPNTTKTFKKPNTPSIYTSSYLRDYK